MVEKRKADSEAGSSAKKAKTEAPTRSSSRIAKLVEKQEAAKKEAAKKAVTVKKTTTAKKAAPKKAAPKKAATAKKAAPKKAATATAKKATTAKKAAPKKATVAKKAAPKKAAPKKATTAKKAAPKKATTAKKAAPKKAATAKKAATKKPVKKVEEEEESEEEEEEEETKVVKKAPAKKAAPKKAAPKKAAPKKAAKKAAPKKAAKKADKEESEEESEEEEEKEKTETAEKEVEVEAEKKEKVTKRKAEVAKEPAAKKQKQAKGKGKQKEDEAKSKEAPADFRLDVPFHPLLVNVLTMGSGEVGQLGLQTIRGRKRPSPLPALLSKNVLKLVVGGLHNFVIVQKGKEDPTDTVVWSWGCNDNKVLGRVTPPADEPEDDEAERPEIVTIFNDLHIIDITTGEYHTAALTRDGTLYLWGSYKEQEGFLGYTKSQKKEQDTPIVFPPTKDIKFKQISSGHNHTLALTHDDRVLVWGYQVTWAEKSEHLVPREIKLPAGEEDQKVVKIFAGGYCNFMITDKDRVYAWGLNNFGQLGIGNVDNTDTVTEVRALSGKKIKSIAPGMHHTVVLSQDGKVYSFGRGSYGQLGTNTSEKSVVLPTEITFPGLADLDRVNQIAGVDNHSVAVTDQGKLYAWGFGDRGQIGNATADDEGSDAIIPFLVQGPQIKDKRVVGAGAGGQHTALLATSQAMDQ